MAKFGKRGRLTMTLIMKHTSNYEIYTLKINDKSYEVIFDATLQVIYAVLEISESCTKIIDNDDILKTIVKALVNSKEFSHVA